MVKSSWNQGNKSNLRNLAVAVFKSCFYGENGFSTIKNLYSTQNIEETSTAPKILKVIDIEG